jgi:glycosyltransferase involved in cell wall biosynthesis
MTPTKEGHRRKDYFVQMNDWKQRCTIGITTRDRGEDLLHTIEKQKVIGLGDMRYIIVDDGSKDAEALRTIVAQLPFCRFVRHESAAGLVQRRQEMAEICETEFLISLDDDSYFVDIGGMAKVVEEFDRDRRLALESFRIVQLKPRERRETRFAAGQLYWFRGCGYVLRVKAFLDVGGYPKELIYGAEETHLTIQFFRAGYEMRHSSDVVVEHQWSGGPRDPGWMEFNMTRSQAVVKLYNEPWLVAIPGLGSIILKRALYDWRNFGHHFRGWCAGIKAGMQGRGRFQKMNINQYFGFRRLRKMAHILESVSKI